MKKRVATIIEYPASENHGIVDWLRGYADTR